MGAVDRQRHLPAKDDLALEKGVLNALRAGLDKIDYKALAPPGSLGMVITFADRAQIRVPMGPLDKLRGAALGTQKDYADTRGVELVKGIELALAELRKVKNPVKALIDGQPTEPQTLVLTPKWAPAAGAGSAPPAKR